MAVPDPNRANAHNVSSCSGYSVSAHLYALVDTSVRVGLTLLLTEASWSGCACVVGVVSFYYSAPGLPQEWLHHNGPWFRQITGDQLEPICAIQVRHFDQVISWICPVQFVVYPVTSYITDCRCVVSNDYCLGIRLKGECLVVRSSVDFEPWFLLFSPKHCARFRMEIQSKDPCTSSGFHYCVVRWVELHPLDSALTWKQQESWSTWNEKRTTDVHRCEAITLAFLISFLMFYSAQLATNATTESVLITVVRYVFPPWLWLPEVLQVFWSGRRLMPKGQRQENVTSYWSAGARRQVWLQPPLFPPHGLPPSVHSGQKTPSKR